MRGLSDLNALQQLYLSDSKDASTEDRHLAVSVLCLTFLLHFSSFSGGGGCWPKAPPLSFASGVCDLAQPASTKWLMVRTNSSFYIFLPTNFPGGRVRVTCIELGLGSRYSSRFVLIVSKAGSNVYCSFPPLCFCMRRESWLRCFCRDNQNGRMGGGSW